MAKVKKLAPKRKRPPKKKMGRPTKYEPRFITEIVEWFDVEKYKDIVIERTTRETKAGINVTEKLKRVANDLPTLDGFARHINVSHDTLLRWTTEVVDPEADIIVLKYPDFCVAYNTAKNLQKNFLVQNGLHGHYPPASFIFVAKNITDMTDKQIIETKDNDLEEKRDALDKWFDTIRNDAKSTKADAGQDEATLPDIQEG